MLHLDHRSVKALQIETALEVCKPFPCSQSNSQNFATHTDLSLDIATSYGMITTGYGIELHSWRKGIVIIRAFNM